MKIGDYYKKGVIEGVVISVNASGQHGLLMSLKNYHCQWYNGGNNFKTYARDFFDGLKNQEYIAKTFDIFSFPAFAYCVSLGEGWYLPSIGELRPLCDRENFIAIEKTLSLYGDKLFPGNHLAELYLSSTEGDTIPYDTDYEMVLVIGVRENGARITSDTKQSKVECVRAVHAF